MRLNHLLRGKRIASGQLENWRESDSPLVLLPLFGIYALCISVGGALMNISVSALGIFS